MGRVWFEIMKVTLPDKLVWNTHICLSYKLCVGEFKSLAHTVQSMDYVITTTGQAVVLYRWVEVTEMIFI